MISYRQITFESSISDNITDNTIHSSAVLRVEICFSKTDVVLAMIIFSGLAFRTLKYRISLYSVEANS